MPWVLGQGFTQALKGRAMNQPDERVDARPSSNVIRGGGTVAARQEQQHRRVTFEDELRTFLTRHGVPFDERYLWD